MGVTMELPVLTLKWTVIVICGACLVYFRNAFMITFLVGAVATSILSKVLKTLLNHSRPTDASPDPGMPSSHAMNIAYLGTYLFLALNNFAKSGRLPPDLKPMLPAINILIIGITIISSLERIRLGYHTPAQVVVGAACGFGVARYWWSITPHVDAHANELLQQIGDTGALVLSLVCLTVGVLVAGPGERAWKASFCGKETPGKASSGAKGSRKTVKIQDRPKKE